MTPEDPDSRRVAEKLRQRERQKPGTDALADPAILAALFEKHEGEVARIIGQTEAAWAERLDALATAQGAAAESLRREIAEKMKGGGAGEIAALERRLREDQRTALAGLSTGLKKEFDALKTSLDTREGGVFAEIDRVAEKVMPATVALGQLQHAVAGTAAAAHDMAAIREAVVDSRQAVDEVVTIRKTVADSRKAIADVVVIIRETVTRSDKAIDAVVEMRPVLDRIETSFDKWTTSIRRLRWFGWVVLVVLAVLFCTGGVALQRETGIWPPAVSPDDRWRNHIWNRYGEDLKSCVQIARAKDRSMRCVIVDMKP